MTLAEAIAVADREYSSLAHSLRIDKEREQRERQIVMTEIDQIRDAACFATFLDAMAVTPPEIMATVLIRFGMRVQRVLDRATTSAAAETVPCEVSVLKALLKDFEGDDPHHPTWDKIRAILQRAATPGPRKKDEAI